MPTGSPASNIGKRYVLHESLGEGGMGVVYRATDRLTGRELALKRVLKQINTADMNSNYDAIDFRLAMAREFRLSATLRHPNIVTVLDYGFDEDKNPYYTMEYLQNATSLVEAGRTLSTEARVDLLLQTLDALAYLHRRGIAHRDLKPANILVTDRQVKVLDFGLSIMHENTQHRTDASDTTVGTLAYIAPELLLGDEVGLTADLYAVGMIAYELFSGKHPFNLNDIAQLVQQIVYGEPDFLALDISEKLVDIIEKLVQKDPRQRYSSAEATIAAFNGVFGRISEDVNPAVQESFLQAARLIGRDDELKQLSDALNRSMSKRGSAWLLSGENGVGKSRLIDELRRLAMVQGATVLNGETLNIGNQPFQVWLMTLRWLCLLDDTLLDDEIALLKLFIDDIDTLVGRDTSHIETSTMDAEALKQWVVTLLERILRQQEHPVVILLEDLHDAGSESLHVLHNLSLLVDELPVLIVGSYSSEEKPDLHRHVPEMQSMRLPRLDAPAIADLSAAMLGEAGRSAQVVELLQRETEGNVYFMIEVIRALAESVGNLAEIGRMTLPQRVFAGGMKSVIERRLARVGENAMTLLQYAAIMGKQLNVNLLQLMLPELDVQRLLMESADAAVLEVQEDTWYFAHEQLREGVLEHIPVQTRKILHGSIAAVVEEYYGETPAYLSVLAYHYRQADNDVKEEYFATLAATQSLKRGAYNEAIEAFTRAQTLVYRLQLDAKQTAYRYLDLSTQIAEAYAGLGNYEEARDWYQRSLSQSMGLHDTGYTALIHTRLGEVALVLNNLDVARQQYEMSLQLYEHIEDESGVASALNGLGNVAYEQGDNSAATQYYQRSLDLARQLGESRGMAGAIRQTQTAQTLDTRPFSYEQTKELYSASLKLYEAQNNSNGISDALYNLGLAAYEAELYDEAIKYLERSIPHLEKADKVERLIQVHNRLGRIATRQKTFITAQKHFSEVIQTQRKNPEAILPTLLNVARLYIAQEHYEKALQLLAFLLHYEHSSASLQDDAETLIFNIEANVPDSAKAWEAGKNSSYADVLGSLNL